MRQNGVDKCPKIRILHSDQVADTCEACDREGPCGDSLFSAKKPPAQPDEDAGSNNGDNEVCKPAKGVEAQDAGQEAANEGTMIPTMMLRSRLLSVSMILLAIQPMMEPVMREPSR